LTSATDTHLLLRAFVDELARCGMRAACTSPGSRCTPIVLTLAREPRLRCYSHVDERCAGFFALGLAKASGLPVAVACTSGTAVAELLAAVIEAHEARVPLLVLSADRPPELRETGAGQTIDQIKLFGAAAKWFFEVGTHECSDESRLRWMRTLACRAYRSALDGPCPGVVHLNFALREPLMRDDASEPLPVEDTGRPDGAPYVRRSQPRGQHVGASSGARGASERKASEREASERGGSEHGASADPVLGELIGAARRGVVVAGRYERATGLGQAAAAFCSAAGWPLLADPLSGARRGETAVAHYDALLRDPSFAAAVTPDLVIRVGDTPTSKPLRAWLARLREDVPQVALDAEGAWQDPDAALSASLALEPARALAELEANAARLLAPVDPDWLSSWRHADEHAASAITASLAASGLSEPVVAAELGRLLPSDATLFVASSMPVRDVESFWPVLANPPRVLCNRGANGIDGTVSSAFGAAAEAEGPTVLLIGDVALAHDLGGLLAARRLQLKLTIVLLENGGGGIFDFLPVADMAMTHERELYTQHISTPTGLDFAQAAALYGLGHERVENVVAFRAALERALARQAGSSIVEVRTERGANVELHQRIWASVADAIGVRFPPDIGRSV
jgi:2-succinyl-5-enolpyruvyl-6-hydroxy-3-cyclohexene-1-carboxylate synthase